MINPKINILDNGLTTAFIQNPSVDFATIHLKGLAGSNYENDKNTGIAHLLEHTLLSNKNASAQALRQEVINKGGKIFGVTSRDDVLFMIKVLSEDVLVGIEYLANIFFSEEISQENVLHQAKVVQAEIQLHQTKIHRVLSYESYSLLYRNQRMAIPNTGTLESLESTDVNITNKFKKSHYFPKNFVLVISGNFNLVKTQKAIAKYFHTRASDTRSAKPKIKINSDECKKVVTLVPNHNASVQLSFYGYKTSDYEKYILHALANIINVNINLLLRDTEGLAYKTKCFSFTGGSYGTLNLQATVNHKYEAKLQKMLTEVFVKLPTIIKNLDIRLIKNQLLADFKFSLEKVSSKAEYTSNLLLHGSENQTYKSELQYILKLKKEDFQTVANKLVAQKPKITVIFH